MKAKRPKAKKTTKRKPAPRKSKPVKRAAARPGRTSMEMDLDAKTLQRAEEFSRKHRTTVPQLVDSYLFELTRDHSEEEPSALVRELYKMTTEGHTTGEYKGHLLKKHVESSK